MFARLSPTVAVSEARSPPLSVTLQVKPPSALVGAPIVALVPVRVKLLAVRPLTAELNVTRYVRLSALVRDVAGLERLIELSVGALLSRR